MKLASLLSEQQVILSMEADEHWAAIVELVESLDTQKLLKGEEKEKVLAALKKREDQTSTGIGSGVAIPHTFSDTIENVVAMFGRSQEGIEFDALDNAPVKFILLFIVPKKDYHLHLQTLAAIAKMFNNCEIRKQLEQATSASKILEILDSNPSRPEGGQITQRLY